MEFITEIWPYVSDHPYIFLFLGMLAGGETFLLPAIYLAAKGMLHFSWIILLSALATLISDTAWYVVGRFFPLEKILSWKMFSKKHDASLKIFSVFRKHSRKLLFISKFVYGTRTLAQVLSGSVRMSLLQYSAINLAGIISYLFVISFAAFAAEESLAHFQKMPYNEYASALIFILVIFITHIWLKKLLGKNFTASSFPPGTKNEQ